MDRVAELVKAYLVPASAMFLLLALSAGLLLLYWRQEARRWARHLLTALAASYWLLATPGFSSMLARGLNPGYEPIASASEAGEAAAVVVLGGGSRTVQTPEGEVHSLSEESARRVLEAVRLYRVLDRPLVVASGGASGAGGAAPESRALAAALQDSGIPGERIVQDPLSSSTHEQAANIGVVLAQNGVTSFVLVTSPEHMNRALASFRKAGLDPIPSASTSDALEEGEGLRRWIPSEKGLARSRAALREYLALLYYFARGWLEVR